MMGSNFAVAAIGFLLALWMVGATLAIWHGLSLRRQSLKALQQTARLNRLLETSPAIPVIVRGDGKIEASAKFANMLGVSGTIETVSALSVHGEAGIKPDDFAALENNIRTAQRTGKAFLQTIALHDSQRRLMVVGNIADPQIYSNGAALLWFFDSTQTVHELETVRAEAENASRAFTALSALIEHSPLPMWHRAPDLKLNFANKAYVAAVGAQDAAQVVQDAMELDDEGQANRTQYAAQAKETGEIVERTIASTIAGARRKLRVIDIPMGDIGVAGIAIDVQELIDTRGDLQRLTDAQRDLLNLMSAGVAQFDSEYALTFANTPFQQIFAFRDQWLADRPEFARVLDRMRENGKIPEVRDFPTWRSECQNWFLSADPIEESWLLPDGKHLRVLAQPVPSGGLLLIFEDRTEHAQLASARDILLRVRTATFDNLSEAIAVFSSDGKLSIWNRIFAETWNVEESVLAAHPRVDELMGSLAKSLRKPAHITHIAELVRNTTAHRELGHGKISFKSGREYEIATVPLPDGNVLLTMIDMTDSLKMEQALRDRNSALSEADAIKGKFLANMSYEFRTPLTSISGFAELLQTGIAGDLSDQAREYVDAIAVSADRLSGQINTVLDYSQIEAGALPIDKKSVPVKSLIENIVARFDEMASEKRIDMRTEIAEHIGNLAGDSARLDQAIGHILENAIRHSPKKGMIEIAAMGTADHIQIGISDSGKGFDAGSMADATRKGLGLPLAQQIIESHGGSMTIESIMGQGTVVMIELPRQ